MYVSFGVPEAQLPDFKRYLAQRSLPVEALPTGDTGPPSRGRVSFVDNAVDQTTGTIRIKGTFPNEDRRLWPGQFVNVVVTLATDPDAVVVPTVAVQAGQQGQFVFVVKPDQTVDLKPVTIARTSGDETIIKDGLTGGETVVTDGQIRLVRRQPHQRQDRRRAERGRDEPLGALHQAAGHDHADHAGDRRVRRDVLPSRCRSATCPRSTFRRSR